jgi:hypothetical protein
VGKSAVIRMKAATLQATEKAVRALLDGLASTLIRLDMTPSRLAQISRAAFVMSAASQSKMKSGRTHIAEIAARTGLNRTEVKRIVAARFSHGSPDTSLAPRAFRVIEAWKTLGPYARKGRPQSLKLNGRAPSFESLCNEHSGDIPYKVILRELLNRKRLKVFDKGRYVSLTKQPRPSQKDSDDLETLYYASAFLRELVKEPDVLVRRKVRVYPPDTITDRFFERSVATQVSDLIENLPMLHAKRRRKSSRKGGVNVYALVSRA